MLTTPLTEKVIMNDLQYQISLTCKHNRDGSFKTQADRQRMLHQIAGQIYESGMKPKSPAGLKEKHIQVVLDRWKAEGLSTGTIKNRMANLRWLAEKAGNPQIIPAKNENLDIAYRRYTDNSINRAEKLTEEKTDLIKDSRLKISLQLQEAFGLRKEEALKIKPEQADGGEKITLQASWTKGGREREIPIRTQEQRDLLEKAKLIAGKNSMIPADKSYKEWAKKYDNVTAKHKIDGHGLRHDYAQERYRELTGMEPPKTGGPGWRDLTDEQRNLDHEARMTVSNELGHGRMEVTNVYLGK